jgi:hypothetical protein
MSELHRGRKLYWNPMLLQSLPLEKFLRVVTDIMQQRLTLFPLLPKDLPVEPADSPECGRTRNWPWKLPKEGLVAAGKAKKLELALNPTTNITTEPVLWGTGQEDGRVINKKLAR